MPCSGVRISWLMVARNWPFTALCRSRQVERLLALVGEDGHLEAQAQHGARGRARPPPFADDEPEEDRHRHAV